MAALARLIPGEAVIAILLWIGIIMVGQEFLATPVRHAPAVALGIIPVVAAWGLLVSQTGLVPLKRACTSWVRLLSKRLGFICQE